MWLLASSSSSSSLLLFTYTKKILALTRLQREEAFPRHNPRCSPCYGTCVNMFERVVSYFLRKYLGWLVKGLDAEALNVSIWGGDIVLNNLELQENALDFLQLPVQVKNGCLQQLKLQIPWTSLGSSQTVIEIKGLYAVVHPSDQFEYNEEEEKQMLAAAKKAKLAELNAAAEKSASDNDEAAGNGGFVAGMITKIVNNLKIFTLIANY